MPPSSIQVLKKPSIPDVDLNLLSEEDAIEVMTVQGSSEKEIIEYLRRREQHASSLL